MGEETDEATPGWEAIDRALDELYDDEEPLHFATLVRWSLGGPDPLDGVSVYPRQEPKPHWHYVSYGLTELYEKESDEAEVSGFGFELTFRLACPAEETEPPTWPIVLMQNLARYVFNTGNVLADGHHLDLQGPITDETDTAIRGLIFLIDPELGGEIDTPHGKITFLEIVGVTLDELEAVQAWSTGAFAEILAETSPLWVTDLKRPSILASGAGARIEEAIEKDGSSCGELAANTVEWAEQGEKARVKIDALLARKLGRILLGRLLHDRALLLSGGAAPEHLVGFRPADEGRARWSLEEGIFVLELDESTVREVAAAMAPKAGELRFKSLPGLTVEIVRSEIKDAEGNVVETLG